ncbi:p21-activated protein kinase-interacting protein 1-like [Calliopsis andreniformis]|uniref:p21-activated protein kinase-interacting protein 1-like n=1 Tax=Calliopsis andreniformis TaxID=337506 RepID=UPI003FCE3E0A
MVCLDSNMPDPFEIIVGTYEQYLLGYKVNNIVNEYKMERTFATRSHLNSVRSIASNKHYLASGGADDSVYLYDMRYRVESGRLIHHNNTVNCVTFSPEASHLFTCSNDGTIAAIRCGNWQIEKHWQKPHKGLAVNTLAIHPTGKIALSTGADGILRTWNLVKGRQAYATNLAPRLKLDAANVTVLKWSPNGEKYLLAVNQRIDIYSVELAGIDSEIKLDSKIICVEFLRDDLIAVGLENGQIKFYDLETSVPTVEAIAHDIRVKCMAFKDDLLVTASSSGEIKLWRYSRHKLDMLQSVNCGARITCLSLAMPCANLVRDTEVKSEEELEEKEKRKFRLRQEVIVEQEGDWEVTPIEDSQKDKKKKKKKRRSMEDSESNPPARKKNKAILKKKKREDDAGEIPTKRSKLWTVEDTNNNNSNEKRKETDESENLPLKKMKSSEKSSKVNVMRKLKKKLRQLEESDDVPPKKKKKKTVAEESGAILKKKKKKQ